MSCLHGWWRPKTRKILAVLPPFRPESFASCSIPPREQLKYLLVTMRTFEQEHSVDTKKMLCGSILFHLDSARLPSNVGKHSLASG